MTVDVLTVWLVVVVSVEVRMVVVNQLLVSVLALQSMRVLESV